MQNSKFKKVWFGTLGFCNFYACLEFRVWNLGFPSSPLTEELSCQFVHNFIDKHRAAEPSFGFSP
jgi:hypothetical protein